MNLGGVRQSTIRHNTPPYGILSETLAKSVGGHNQPYCGVFAISTIQPPQYACSFATLILRLILRLIVDHAAWLQMKLFTYTASMGKLIISLVAFA